MGQPHIAAAVLHELEQYPVFGIDHVSLSTDNATRSPEESLCLKFKEAARNAPSIIYLPNLAEWDKAASPALRLTLLSTLEHMSPTLPILVLTTVEDNHLYDVSLSFLYLFACN